MKMTLKVTVDGNYEKFYAAIEVPDIFQKEFEPNEYDDIKLLASIVSDLPINHPCKLVTKIRRDAAEILASRLTEMLIHAMEQSDELSSTAKP